MEKLSASEIESIATGSNVREQYKINRRDGRDVVSAEETNGSAKQRLTGRQKHISEQPLSIGNFFQKIQWLNTTLVLLIPFVASLSQAVVPLQKKTLALAVFWYVMSALGITAGYHRLFAHRAYDGTPALRLFLMLWGSAAVQGSVKWWSNGHRTHHRFTDTDKDPYNAKRGFWHSHLGWMIFVQNPKLKGRTDISDLLTDPLVTFQHKHYLWFLITTAYLLPMMIAGLGWGDYKGGLIYAGILRLFWVHQATFCVNSLAHWIGEQPFDDRNTPRDHVLTAFVTLGEGYHNFHHEFPSDYRNALKWYQFDPTKVFIWVCYQLGFAYNLQRFSQNAIEQGIVQQKQKKLDRWRQRLNWGVPIDQLPVIEFDDFKAEAKNRDLIVISGIVHDVTDFVDRHPGGRALIKSGVGRDATAVFNGGVYNHHNAAHNLLANMRVAVVRGGCEVEVWKKAHAERKDQDPLESNGQPIYRAGQQPSQVPSFMGTPSA